MKKYISFILVLVMLVYFFAGCTNVNSNKEYKTAIISYSDSLGIKNLSVEYEIYDYKGFENKKGPQKVSFKHQGKEVSLDLSYTDGEFLRDNYYPVYKYGDIAWFNPNGKIERYSLFDVTDRPSEITCSEEDAIQVATDFMKDIVNVDEYTVSVLKLENNWNMYEVYFHKYVDGTKTTEKACVGVTFDGKFCDYTADMLDQFSDVTKNPFDMDKIKNTVYARLEKLLENIDKDKYYKIEYSDEEFQLTRLKNGELAIKYTVTVDCFRNISERIYTIDSELIEMLIMQ